MKYKSVLTVLAVFVAVFACSVIGYILGATATPDENQPAKISQTSNKVASAKTDNVPGTTAEKKSTNNANPVKKLTPGYILRESDGKIALFIKNSDGTESLHSSYDVPIAFLPKSDRDSLKKGIEFESLDEIIKFVEDYVG